MRSIGRALSTSRRAIPAPSRWSSSPSSCFSPSSSSASWNRGSTTDERPTPPRPRRRAGPAPLRRGAGTYALLLDGLAVVQDAGRDLLADHRALPGAAALGQLRRRLRAHDPAALSPQR